uniref:DNA-directed RNA polymerase n=1 Tax=Ascaris lumbricoides TaxID=6252 RepID=A0A0M3I8W2_ASCLU
MPGLMQIARGKEEEYTRKNMPLSQYYDGKKIVLPVSDKATIDMYKHWIHQGLSGLMSSIGLAKAQKLNEFYRRKFFACSQNAENIYKHSACVNDVIEAEERYRLSPLRAHKVHLLSKLNSTRDKKMFSRRWVLHEDEIAISGMDIKNRIYRPNSEPAGSQPHHEWLFNRWVGGFKLRVKRMAKSKWSYSLKTKEEQLSPFGSVAHSLLKMLRKLKGKSSSQTFEEVLDNIRKTQEGIERKKAEKVLIEKRMKEMYASKKGRKLIKIKDDTNGAISEINNDQGSSAIAGTDIGQQILAEQMKFIECVVSLAKVIGNGNGSTEIGVLKIFSPRILSIAPEEGNTHEINLLSPSLFSLHNKGKGLEALLSFPNAMKAIDNPDYRQWMDLIIEASGVPGAVETARKYQVLEVAGNLDDAPRGIDGQPMHFNKENVSEILGEHERRKIELFEGLQANFTEKQMKDFKGKGYSILTKPQMEQVYGERSPYNDSSTLKLFKSMSETEIRRRLQTNLRELQKASRAPHRRKRQLNSGIILSPVFLTAFINDAVGVSQPLVLSPVAIAVAVNSPSLFGAVLVSPWILAPLINSPRILSPTILSPVSLAAVILSPLTLNPFILAPGALLPVVLSPLVLDPFILSPQACTPIVLSPLALSPFIFNPSTLSPLILSPFVFTPSVFSPSYVSALILSPHAFSPLINSTGKFVSVVFSPNAFS